MTNGQFISTDRDKFGRTEMDFFDILPQAIRVALTESKVPVGAKGMYELWTWVRNEQTVIAAIKGIEQIELEKANVAGR